MKGLNLIYTSIYLVFVLFTNICFGQNPVNFSNISQSGYTLEEIVNFNDCIYGNKQTTYFLSGEMYNYKNNSERVFLDVASTEYFYAKIHDFNNVKVIRFNIGSLQEFNNLKNLDFSYLENLSGLEFIFFLFEYDLSDNQANELVSSLNISANQILFYDISIAN